MPFKLHSEISHAIFASVQTTVFAAVLRHHNEKYLLKGTYILFLFVCQVSCQHTLNLEHNYNVYKGVVYCPRWHANILLMQSIITMFTLQRGSIFYLGWCCCQRSTTSLYNLERVHLLRNINTLEYNKRVIQKRHQKTKLHILHQLYVCLNSPARHAYFK